MFGSCSSVLPAPAKERSRSGWSSIWAFRTSPPATCCGRPCADGTEVGQHGRAVHGRRAARARRRDHRSVVGERLDQPDCAERLPVRRLSAHAGPGRRLWTSCCDGAARRWTPSLELRVDEDEAGPPAGRPRPRRRRAGDHPPAAADVLRVKPGRCWTITGSAACCEPIDGLGTAEEVFEPDPGRR